MDWSAIITAVVAATASIVGSYLTNEKRRREEAVADAVKEQEQNSRLKSIEEKLDIHNGYAAKFGSIEKAINGLDMSVALIQQDIKHIKESK